MIHKNRNPYTMFVKLMSVLVASSTIACVDEDFGIDGKAIGHENPVEEISLTLESAADDASGEGNAQLRRGENDLTLDFSPPSGVYITSFTETIEGEGRLPHAVYFYQPNPNEETVRFLISAESAPGIPDLGSTISKVSLISHPDNEGQTETPLDTVPGSNAFEATTFEAGWYALKFVLETVQSNYTLTYKSFDSIGEPLMVMWIAPSGRSAKVKAEFRVDNPIHTYFKGGTFSNTSIYRFAYTDNVSVDDRLLYRTAFDQGLFNYPIGYLAPGNHIIEFDFSAWWYAPSQSWFGVSHRSFDPAQSRTGWRPVQFLYSGPMHTGDYDAWTEGLATAQGPTLDVGVRPPPIRRGTNFEVACDHPALEDPDANATLKILPYGSEEELDWFVRLAPGLDYAGGIYENAGNPQGSSFVAHHREHWRITVPQDAPIGRYVLRAVGPNGTPIDSDVLFYVIHNPYNLMRGSDGITKPELETWGYDEDDDGLNWNLFDGPATEDHDHLRDNFTLVIADDVAVDEHGIPISQESYTVDVTYTASFRRSSNYEFSILDYAMASANGTTTEMETMIRLFRYLNQRMTYNKKGWALSSAEILVDYTSQDALTAIRLAGACSQPGYAPICTKGGAICYNMARMLASLARSTGILSRVASNGSAHAVTEVYMPTLPLHGGSSDNSIEANDADVDHWYVFDATDHLSSPESSGEAQADLDRMPGDIFNNTWESVGPRQQYCLANRILVGNSSYPGCTWLTSNTDWTAEVLPFSQYRLQGDMVEIWYQNYNAENVHWITQPVTTGWLSFGDKDVYKIDKATVNADYIRVEVLPSAGGENLKPEICLLDVPESGFPHLQYRCADAASIQEIPPGISYVVVFNDSQNLARYHGDMVNYRIEVGDGITWNRCDDKRLNSDETDVDCGGNCPGCDAGQRCVSTLDCLSKICNVEENEVQGVCAPSTCDDGIRNGSEIDEDCGRGCLCTIGQLCEKDTDCLSGNCAEWGRCSATL